MSLLITKKCTNCDMCEMECPNNAISLGSNIFEIDPSLCTECVGHYDKPTCQSVCPINNCIIKDPNNIESIDELWEKFVLLHHSEKL